MSASQRYIAHAHDRYAAGDMEGAAALYERGMALGCADPLAYLKLGNVNYRAGRLAQALEGYRHAIDLDPANADAHFNLGVAFAAMGRLSDAEQAYAAALALDAGHAGALVNRTAVLHRGGRLAEAAQAGTEALERDPASAPAWNNLALVMLDLGRSEEAVGCIRQAIALAPADADSWNNANRVLWEFGALAEARACAQRAIELMPAHMPAWIGLGTALYLEGEVQGAVDAYRQAIALGPEGHPRAAAAHSAWLGLQVLRREDPQRIFQEHMRWGALYADPLTAAAPPHEPDLDPERPLTIGYVSGDFREHSMCFFIAPVLAQHDRKQFRVIGYDNWAGSDAVNARLQGYADAWRKVGSLDDAQLAEQIRADGVDILIDLSGHTLGNRLLAFARKPAPVQAGWLGYMVTSGMRAMDYHITDAYLDPPGAGEQRYSEKLVRLSSAAAFSPAADSPDVNALPAQSAGYVRFASVNNYSKIGDDVIALWAGVLARCPGARLLLVAAGGNRADVQEAVRTRFERCSPEPGVAERIDVRGRTSLGDFLRLLHEIDIALDPFPYSGGTTSLHTLWMGVPIVTLEGESEISRSTGGMLRGCGLEELVARDEADYLERAVALAHDLPRLAALRAGLRARLAASALGNTENVTRDLEMAYRTMWKSYVAQFKA